MLGATTVSPRGMGLRCRLGAFAAGMPRMLSWFELMEGREVEDNRFGRLEHCKAPRHDRVLSFDVAVGAMTRAHPVA